MCIVLKRPPLRRRVWTGPHLGMVDWQGVIPRAWCPVCGGEVFLWGTELCPRCKEERYVHKK